MLQPLHPSPAAFKIPESVLVVIYTPEQDVLLIRRADWCTWQSVTGSKDHLEESWLDTAIREVQEETGIDACHPSCHLQDWQLENVYDIYPAWRWRYAPEISRNTERVFGLRVPEMTPIMAFPSMIIIGKDGTVRKTHAGYAGPATGIHHEAFKQNFNKQKEALLVEKEGKN
jgi:dATP pyrophosphohydrolase